MPLISVIIPVYNAQQTLNRCIDSVLANSYSDIEIILVDDCSIDASKDICESYVQKYSDKVKLISLSHNSGVSAARNAGIDAAQGEYIMFADSDDYVMENWCEALYKWQEKYPKSLIVCNLCDVNSQGYSHRGPHEDQIISYYDLFANHCSGSLCNKIFKYDLVKTLHLKFNQGCIVGEDAIFVTDYAKYCDSIFYIGTPLYYYWENTYSATHRYHEDWLRMHLHPFFARIPLIDDKNIAAYCDSWFPFFIAEFENIFDKRCKKSFIEKMNYNHKVMQSKEFQFCAEHISGGKDSKLFMMVVKTYNYYVLWIFQRIVSLKRLLKKK